MGLKTKLDLLILQSEPSRELDMNDVRRERNSRGRRLPVGSQPDACAHEVAATGKAELVEHLEHQVGSLPGGAWPVSPPSAVVLSLLCRGMNSRRCSWWRLSAGESGSINKTAPSLSGWRSRWRPRCPRARLSRRPMAGFTTPVGPVALVPVFLTTPISSLMLTRGTGANERNHDGHY